MASPTAVAERARIVFEMRATAVDLILEMIIFSFLKLQSVYSLEKFMKGIFENVADSNGKGRDMAEDRSGDP